MKTPELSLRNWIFKISMSRIYGAAAHFTKRITHRSYTTEKPSHFIALVRVQEITISLMCLFTRVWLTFRLAKSCLNWLASDTALVSLGFTPSISTSIRKKYRLEISRKSTDISKSAALAQVHWTMQMCDRMKKEILFGTITTPTMFWQWLSIAPLARCVKAKTNVGVKKALIHAIYCSIWTV